MVNYWVVGFEFDGFDLVFVIGDVCWEVYFDVDVEVLDVVCELVRFRYCDDDVGCVDWLGGGFFVVWCGY